MTKPTFNESVLSHFSTRKMVEKPIDFRHCYGIIKEDLDNLWDFVRSGRHLEEENQLEFLLKFIQLGSSAQLCAEEIFGASLLSKYDDTIDYEKNDLLERVAGLLAKMLNGAGAAQPLQKGKTRYMCEIDPYEVRELIGEIEGEYPVA